MERQAKNTKIIYKGDVLASTFYLFLGVLSILIALGLYYFTTRLGFHYLTIGMSLFAVYMIGKGCVMLYFYYSRYQFYKDRTTIDQSMVKDERNYTRYRILKKKRNRKWYFMIGGFCSLAAFAGIFHQEKGLIIATCIPIVLMSFLEFSIGLLTEFRLSEYLRQLDKMI